MRRIAIALLCVFACKSDKGPDPTTSPDVARVTTLSTGADSAARPDDWIIGDRFVIQDAGSSTGWGSYGGSIVDIAPGGAADPLTEIFFQCELRAFAPLT